MGDILHALPAVASLRLSFPEARISWVLRPNWLPLLEGNPNVDVFVPYRRGEGIRTLLGSVQQIRGQRPDLALDFQGLLQSALIGRLSRPEAFWGFDKSVAREPLASLFYTETARAAGKHRIERNLDLAKAAGATQLTNESWIPQGTAEGDLPSSPFVLASPFAGWTSKQWPLESYRELATLLNREGIELVLNVAPHQAAGLEDFQLHVSSLRGLIDATRRAAAVVGVDSGPLHLAAALRKPGVAVFGPTDPEANGPFGGTMRVLRDPGHATSYKREDQIHASMRSVSAAQVFEQLLPQLRAQTTMTGLAQ